MENKFDALVNSFGEHDTEFKSLKKVCDAEKDQIKAIMQSDMLGEYTSDKYKLTCTESERTAVNEEVLLDILLAHKDEIPDGIIKTKSYVDSLALESAIYNGNLDVGIVMELGKATTTTKVVTLKCSKVKSKKEDI